jgi:predicted dehydrogenase
MYEMALVEARVPFLVEKPIGLDRQVILAVAEAVDRAAMPVAVGFNWRASDFLPALRELLRAHPPRMVIGRYHGGTPQTGWWRQQARSGGQFVEQACHVVDLARCLVGEAGLLAAAGSNAPLPDYPGADVAGAGAALLRFAGGQPGVFTATCLQPEIGGADLTLICDKLRVVVGQKGYSVRRPEIEDTVTAGADAYARQDLAFTAAVRSGDASGLFCDYAGAVGTAMLCLDIRDAIAAS